jgi:hypothetical protein
MADIHPATKRLSEILQSHNTGEARDAVFIWLRARYPDARDLLGVLEGMLKYTAAALDNPDTAMHAEDFAVAAGKFFREAESYTPPDPEPEEDWGDME